MSLGSGATVTEVVTSQKHINVSASNSTKHFVGARNSFLLSHADIDYATDMNVTGIAIWTSKRLETIQGNQ
jgi:hypothetical protein